MKKLLIMAAGTGGHIFPGLAIAATMRARDWQVSWLGTQHGMEGGIVPQHQIELDAIDFAGLRGKGLAHGVRGMLKMVKSFLRCYLILGQRQPDVVLGMGGYVTVPGGLMARLRGIPLVLINADATLLMSNKALAPIAQRVLFGLPARKSTMRGNMRVTGNPVRQAILDLPRPEQRFASHDGSLHLLIVGGSLGASVLNQTLPAALARIPEAQRPRVTHQSGKQHSQALRVAYAEAGVEAEILDFIDDMPRRYSDADLVVCRAGAITVSELTAAGVASILVPLVVSTTSHQRDNARWMAEQKAAIYLPQQDMSPEQLSNLLGSITRADCLRMAQAAYVVGVREANQTIASILEELAEVSA
jgi:UDP-N-acetylglucosamine--N-acetylmuramyl-(pentapeptide) pyrophosphoryl-undecaprenol N-acetylglucosamine transferase